MAARPDALCVNYSGADLDGGAGDCLEFVMTKILTDRATVERALAALESGLAFHTHSTVLQNLRKALEQPEQRISDDPIYIASDGGFYPMPRQRKPLEGKEQ